ncbi:MAG TPA: hypothetical protein VNC50_16865, partial [Planctomycetia bacterium]|nr:hypothetical protein [Planctomycetia bacterium]
MRHQGVWIALAGTMALGLGAARGADLTSLDDANLRAVHFFDENEGWAVGDDGVIYHTVTGGKQWDRQPSGTNATLTGISASDMSDGWIVGRRSLPYSGQSNGVLLAWHPALVRWQPMQQGYAFPGLYRVQMVDGRKGWAAGDTTDQNPSGLWLTVDSGRSWAPHRSARNAGWRAAAFFDPNNGVLGGLDRSLAVLRAG